MSALLTFQDLIDIESQLRRNFMAEADPNAQ